MNNLLYRFRRHWEQAQYVPQGSTVLLAVSGGRDSMVMASLFRGCDIAFAVAHCNFGLRGEESDKDEQLVRQWCSEHSVALHVNRFDTSARKEEWKKGTQETARILRYEWFDELRKEHNYARIATAHHANDNAETLLINLCKGTGIAGLHGILPDNGSLIRPMLFAARAEITAYAKELEIPYRDDASNDSDDYLRNALRHHIMPAIEQWFPGGVMRINDSISRFAEAETIYKKGIETERKKLLEKRGNDYYIPVLKLRHRQPLATICYELLQPFGFSPAQVPDIIHLLSAESGRYVASATHKVIRHRDFLVVAAIQTVEADLIQVDAVPCILHAGEYTYSFSVENMPDTISANANEAWLDMKHITFPLVLRTWKTGDYFYPFGMQMKKKKVSRLLIDAKMPLHEKEQVRVLECGKRIAWVAGMRPDERFRVGQGTKEVLVVRRRLA